MANKVLLHACCAVCLAHPFELLKNEGYEPVIYFYNPNIYPYDEYLRRFEELKRYSVKKNFKVIEENYSPDDFYEIAKGLEACPEKGERCFKCYELRLAKTIKKAKEMNITCATTTLTVSPHKNSNKIFEIGEALGKSADIEFLKIDFKKKDGFKITNQLAKENGFYRQNYCGCEFSMTR